MSKNKNQAGFTIIELLVALLAASVVTYAAMSLYITQHKQMIVQEQITDMQNNVRAAAELIAKAARMAGYNIPITMNAIETYNSNPDTIVLTYDSGIIENTRLEQTMTSLTADLNCNGHNLTNLIEGSSVYIFDPDAEVGEFVLVTSVLSGPARIRHDLPVARLYPMGSKVISLNRVRFFVDQPDTLHSDLMIQTYGMTPQVFAENIIGLNFRYFLDNGSIVTQTATPEKIRMVEIDVVGRTASADEEFVTNYRTRNFTLRVKVRNLAL